MPLPPDFNSLYRLFLRTSSASVLHQNRGVRNLRRLWRPSFDNAAYVTNQLQNESLLDDRRNELQEWLKTWHIRIDNTLALLYTSSKSRGLPHRVTRNLAILVQREQYRLNSLTIPRWKASLPADAREYKGSEDKQLTSMRQREAETTVGWNALEEVVRLAEGRDRVSLGKIALRRVFKEKT